MGMRGMKWIKWILECQQECILLVYNSLVTSVKIGGLSKTMIDFSHSIVLSKSILSYMIHILLQKILQSIFIFTIFFIAKI